MCSTINQQTLNRYQNALLVEERSQNTIQKYMRDVRKFVLFLGERELNKLEVLAFKSLLVEDYSPASVNSMLAAVNSFLSWMERAELRVKPLKIQRDMFIRPEKELSQREYERLIEAAERRGNRRLSLMIQTICATGIRVSELEFITVQALHIGRATVRCKGKNRVIFIPKELCRQLKLFAKERGIRDGFIFVTRGGKPIERSNIWKMMKSLCREARVSGAKVFPHNLRHLFARTYYKIEKDISRLADILGHGSVNTTRIYTIESGWKHARQVERMGLVLCGISTT